MLLGSLIKEEVEEIHRSFNQIAPGILRMENIDLLGAPLTDFEISWSIQSKLSQVKLISSVEKIVNRRFDKDASNEATLSVKCVRILLRSATNLCYSSCLGSIHSIADLLTNITPSFSISSDELVGEALKLYNHGNQLLIQNENSGWKFQIKWDNAICLEQHKRNFENYSTNISRARILANRSKESSDWLNAFLSSSLSSFLHDQSFKISVSLRMGSQSVILIQCMTYLHAYVDYKSINLTITDFVARRVPASGRRARHEMVNESFDISWNPSNSRTYGL